MQATPAVDAIIPGVRRTTTMVTAIASVAAATAAVAYASASANGLPSYTDGFARWPRLNPKPITRCGPPCAHPGTKNVYASKRSVDGRYPNGTVVVKTVAQRGDRPARPSQVAVMRKANGTWRYVEYALSGSRYVLLAQGQLCQSCHARARAKDYVFTR